MSLHLVAARADSDDAVALLAGLDAFVAARYPPESCYGLSVAELLDPRVVFLVARLDGSAVGCGGIFRHDDWAEVKRVFVRPEARGRGVAAALIAELERRARADGLRWLRLETGNRQPGAIALYERLGFGRRGPFGDWETVNDPLSVYFEKAL